IPFPSYEIFRLIPWREELINGMFGADLIGFHTFDDVRHFLSAASKIVLSKFADNVILHNERQIVVESFPMGIDDHKFESLISDPAVQEHVATFKDSLHDLKTILSIDRLDYSKGILQRLMAFELFLQTYPEWVEKINLYMIVV